VKPEKVSERTFNINSEMELAGECLSHFGSFMNILYRIIYRNSSRWISIKKKSPLPSLQSFLSLVFIRVMSKSNNSKKLSHIVLFHTPPYSFSNLHMERIKKKFQSRIYFVLFHICNVTSWIECRLLLTN